MKEPDLEEDMLSAVGRGGSLVIERRSVQDQIDPVEVTLPSGEKKTLTLSRVAPGLWRQRLASEHNGVYRLKSGKLTSVCPYRIGQFEGNRRPDGLRSFAPAASGRDRRRRFLARQDQARQAEAAEGRNVALGSGDARIGLDGPSAPRCLSHPWGQGHSPVRRPSRPRCSTRCDFAHMAQGGPIVRIGKSGLRETRFSHAGGRLHASSLMQ